MVSPPIRSPLALTAHSAVQLPTAMNEKSNFAFITNLFYWQGTAVPAIIPQLVAIGIFTLTVKLIWYWAELDIPDLRQVHQVLRIQLRDAGVDVVAPPGGPVDGRLRGL